MVVVRDGTSSHPDGVHASFQGLQIAFLHVHEKTPHKLCSVMLCSKTIADDVKF
jgi:hypothetical protein